jgi:cellulose synthase/poly-beta-1,6-N-acetylglucosamine synthase-like glycosyltransferase
MIFALASLSWLIFAMAALPLAVLSYELLAGLWAGRADKSGGAMPSCAVLIPAHDEEGGIAATLTALKAVAPEELRIVVVADNCSDATAENARQCGVEVIERHDTNARGKGFALAFGRDHLARSNPPEVVLVLDADCRLHKGSVEALAKTAHEKQVPTQAINLIDGDLKAAAMVQVSSFAMLVKNLLRTRGMQRLGGAALLTGTGMAFPWSLIVDAKLATSSIVEDLALGVEFAREGHPPLLLSSAHVRSAPADMRDALAQKTRWEHGFLQTLRSSALPVFFGGLRRFSLSEILLGLHLMVPPLALLLMLSGLAQILLIGAAWLGSSFFAGAAWNAAIVPMLALAGLLGLALTLIFIGWLIAGRPFLSGKSLLSIPFYIIWKLPVYLSFLKGPQALWNRTPRRP